MLLTTANIQLFGLGFFLQATAPLFCSHDLMSFITLVKTYLRKALIRLKVFFRGKQNRALRSSLGFCVIPVKETCRSCIYFAA